MAPPFPVVGLHLDLKYLMPRKTYLLRWLHEIAACGINTLLLEYEDKFPWSNYPFLQADGAFTPDELRAFLREARGLGLRVVPLVQSLSHLEFALAHEELAHLREMPDICTQINPSNPDAIRFIEDLQDEVLAYHEADEWFHIGADEAWFLGANPQYAAEVHSIGERTYWARHTRHFVERIIARGKRPIVWDDVLWRGQPAAIAPDFPRQTILAAWDYGDRVFEPTLYPQVEVFQDAGFDVIGVPCLNWGVLTPMHDHSLENTEVWAAKARNSGLMGLINSSWASFHTPLPTQILYVAATSALLTEDRSGIDAAWQNHFLEQYFGAPAAELPRALLALGTKWEHEVGLERPITPIIYCYMDMMLHFTDGFAGRQRRGGYPLDWGTIDFVSIYRQKIELLRQDKNQDAVHAKLVELQENFDFAAAVLAPFANAATRHPEEAALLSLFAQMKALHARVVSLLVFGEGDANALQTQLAAREPMLECLSPFFEAPSLRKLERMWWEPAAVVLEETLHGNAS